MRLIVAMELEVNDQVYSGDHNDLMLLEITMINALKKPSLNGEPIISSISRLNSEPATKKYEVRIATEVEDGELSESRPLLSRP